MRLDPVALYTRQQISHRTGLSDGVLGFWIKNGLLAASQGGAGRGSHRRFSDIQVSFAGIFGQLQQVGLNIGKLKALSAILQRGVEICETLDLTPSNLQMATLLAKELSRFRRGCDVFVYGVRPDNSVTYLLATNEDEISYDIIEETKNREAVIAFARELDEGDIQAVETYAVVRDETDNTAISDYSWLVWQDEGGIWHVAEQTDPSHGFREPPTAETGIFLAVGKVVRRVWGFDLEERRKRRRADRLAKDHACDPKRIEQLISQGLYDEADRKMAELINAEPS